MITLHPKKEFRFPIMAECINPDVFDGKTCVEIEEFKVWEGNKEKKLGEIFKIEETQSGNPDEDTITIRGNIAEVRRMGTQMTKGRLTIHGDVGMHLGEEMKGGTIIVNGNVGSWAGSMMKGGIIEIHGNVSDYLGAPYRGSREGMNGGRIVVYGNVGSEAGIHMKKGLIKVYGCAGQFAGFRMHNGTLYVQKDAEARAGACMTGGKLIVGGVLESVLPTFTIEGVKGKVKIEEEESVEGPLYLFLGDLTEHGEGKLYVSKEKNPHLSHYERFL